MNSVSAARMTRMLTMRGSHLLLKRNIMCSLNVVTLLITTFPVCRSHLIRLPATRRIKVGGAITTTATCMSTSSSSSATSSPLLASTAKIPRVIVARTRQSKSFRDGNPLVFAGAISYTQSAKDQADERLQLASLVAVEVQTAKQTTTGNNNNKKKRTNRNRKQTTSPQYPHYHASSPVQAPNDATQFIGWGVYNPHSMYRVRILCHAMISSPALMAAIRDCNDESDAIGLIVQHKIDAAIRIRRDALNLPNAETDTYRLVNGEGDGLSGLAIDVLGGKVAVVMSSAAWCEVHRTVIMNRLEESLSRHHQGHSSSQETALDIVWKTTAARLRQDGMEDVPEDESFSSDNAASDDAMVIATEAGIRYQSFPFERGQKTGVYCDQRENRWNLALLCRDKRVLDLCCFHGGFSLNAKIHGGATSCICVDSSQNAIDTATANAKLNDLDDDSVAFVKADISNFMKQEISSGSSEYDVVVLDPPKLAPTVAGLDRASRKYHSLNRDALKLVSPTQGGLLFTCTCSAAMTQKDGGQYFLDMVHQAALAAGRQITLLRVSGAAACHTQIPASYPAGAYLTAALFHVSPSKISEDVK